MSARRAFTILADALIALMIVLPAVLVVGCLLVITPVARWCVRRRTTNLGRPRRQLVLGYTSLDDGSGKGNLTDYDLWYNPGQYFERVYVYVPRTHHSVSRWLTSTIHYRQDKVAVGRLGERTSPTCLILDWLRASFVALGRVLRDRIDVVRVDGPHFNALIGMTVRLVTGLRSLLFIEALWQKILPKQTYMAAWKRRLLPIWYRLCYRVFDAFIGTPSYAPEFYEPLGLTRQRIWPYRRTVDVRLAERAGEAPLPPELEGRPHPWIVVVGRLHEEKLSRDAIQVARTLRDGRPTFTLVMVGDGPLRGELEAETRRLDLSDRIVYTGALPLAQVLSVVKACDVALSPYGGTSNVETMLVGTPIVGYDNEPTRLTVTDGETGLIVPEGDVASAAAAVNRLLDDEDLGRRLSDAALAYARREYEPGVISRCWTQPLEALFGAWSSRAPTPLSPLADADAPASQ